MIGQRTLDQMFGIAGGGLIVGAVIAGLILTGGLGKERERRLEEITQRRINNVAVVLQCAFNATGQAPTTFEEAKATPRAPNERHAFPLCEANDVEGFKVADGITPREAGTISYQRESDTHVKVCGNFRAPFDSDIDRYYAGMGVLYPQLDKPRPAGVHCYTFDLVQG